MCGTATWWAKLALLAIILATMLHIGGWASNNWMTYESSESRIELDVGLWRQKNCTAISCKDGDTHSEFVTEEFNVVRGLETAVVVGVLALTVMLIVYVCAESSRVTNFAVFIIIICFLSGLACLIGIFIFISTVPSPFVTSYSMGLTVIACMLILLAGTLMVPEILDSDEPYRAPRSVSPLTPRDRRTVITPISYRGSYNGGFRY